MAEKLDHTKLFDFVKILFTNRAEYEKLLNADKSRHHFMTNRFFAINHPVQANLFNKVGINGAAVVDCWAMVAQKYNRVPGWIYTKVRKSEKEKAKEYQPNEEVLNKYLELNKIGMREYKEALKFNPEALKGELKKLEKQMGLNGSKSK